MRRARKWSIVAVTLLLAACTVPLTDAEVGTVMRRSAGAGPEAKLVILNAATQMEAMTLVVEARSNGPIVPSKRLALGFAAGAQAPVHFLVGGPHPTLNDQVVRDAFSLCKEPRVPGLRVTFVSPNPPTAELVKLASDYRAKLVHALYVPPGS